MKHTLHLHILIAAYITITANLCIAMEITPISKLKSIAFPDKNTVVVGGIGGCGIFNSRSQKLIHQLTTNNIIHLAANDDTVACIDDNVVAFYNKKTGEKKWRKNFFTETTAPLALKNNTLYTYNYGWLVSFNYIEQTSSKIKLSDQHESFKDTIISYHPQTNAILYCSDNEILSIVQPSSNHPIKINLNTDLTFCQGGEYSADGTKIAFCDSHNKYFIYDLVSNNSCAYELTANKKKYVAAAFHPLIHLLALLSHDNIVHYWDYLSRKLVAKTYALTNDIHSKINKYKPTKRLAFAPDGSRLAIALKNNWAVIDVPKNNTDFPMIYYLLRINQIPKELVYLVMKPIIGNCALSKINCAALSKIAPIVLSPQIDIYQQQEETENRDIKIINLYSNKNS